MVSTKPHMGGNGILTSECLFNIHHFPRAGLHEAVPSTLCPCHTISCADLSHTLQVALVARHNTDRQHLALLIPRLALQLDQCVKVLERVQRVGRCDVVDQEKGIGMQVRGRPQASVLLLPCRVGEREGVGHAVDCARHRVRVFDCWVVSVAGLDKALPVLRARDLLMRPLAAHQTQRDRGFAAPAVAAYRDRDLVRLVHTTCAVSRSRERWRYVARLARPRQTAAVGLRPQPSRAVVVVVVAVNEHRDATFHLREGCTDPARSRKNACR